jgi:hypothetical protein
VRLRESQFQASSGKKTFQDFISMEKKLDMSSQLKWKSKIGESWSRLKARLYLQNDQSKKGCKCDSSDNVPTLLAQSPEFKPMKTQTTKKKIFDWHRVVF